MCYDCFILHDAVQVGITILSFQEDFSYGI